MKGWMTIVIFLGLFITGYSQPVLVGGFVEAEGLICFPVYGDSTQYRYLPSRGRLATTENDLPEFSFLQYAVENTDAPVSGSSITEANGGGLIHFLVLYDTPEDQVRKAERELKRKLKRQDLRLSGPVEINAGKFMLISSLLIDGKEQKEIIGTGVAPVFQNSRVAFSFLVEPLKARLLMESFKMATPDISITFDLEFSGLTNAYNGQLVVDWAQVQESEYSNSSVDAIFYSSDVEKSFGSLIQNGAIRMETYGNDSIASDLLSLAYDRLLKLMFDPVRPDSIPPEKTRGALEEIFGRRGLLGGLVGGSDVYKKQTIRTSGETVVQINSRKLVQRHHLLTFNIGDLHKNFGDNERIFRKVAIDDPAFQQREVLVNLDGSIRDEFEDMISSVSVTMRKKHQNGDETVREIFVNKDVLSEYDGTSKLIYLNKGDNNRTGWLDYDYLVNWQFKKDGNYVADWVTANSPVINLYTPYKYRQIDLIGDVKKLEDTGVIAVSVEISYPFFDRTKKDRVTIKTKDDQADYNLEAILPLDTDIVDYSITWIFREGRKVMQRGQDEYGVILIDEVPNE
ncbi:MAG TPA: hypothetical protein VIH22_07400 [Cyclobacteriaceae bacterium]